MSHGGGGKAMQQLIEQLFVKHFDNPALNRQNDQARLTMDSTSIVMSTDGHVISPLFFPGGDIGSLSVHGTINDIAMSGATPKHLAAGFILEEGLPLADLEQIVISMAQAAKEAGVTIVTGDTKVVEKGKADGVFITTTGVGSIAETIDLGPERIQPGDAIIVNGYLGDHGVAIMAKRENLEFETTICSDTASLHGLVATMLERVPDLHCLRDPTRGGLAAVLNELAHQTQLGMQLQEAAIPVRREVQSACELLGLDPLYVANEGKLVCFCPADQAEALLDTMATHPLAKNCALVGRVVEQPAQLVTMQTQLGGQRVVDWLSSEQLPRIC